MHNNEAHLKTWRKQFWVSNELDCKGFLSGSSKTADKAVSLQLVFYSLRFLLLFLSSHLINLHRSTFALPRLVDLKFPQVYGGL